MLITPMYTPKIISGRGKKAIKIIVSSVKDTHSFAAKRCVFVQTSSLESVQGVRIPMKKFARIFPIMFPKIKNITIIPYKTIKLMLK